MTTNGQKVKEEETLVMWMLQEFCDRGTLIDAGESRISSFGSLIPSIVLATTREACISQMSLPA